MKFGPAQFHRNFDKVKTLIVSNREKNRPNISEKRISQDGV